MGARVRDTMEAAGLTIVAAPGYRAPGVAVAYVGDKTVAGRFKAAGFQIAAGVPYMLETQPEMATFRFGLFGLDKVKDPDGTVRRSRVRSRRRWTASSADLSPTPARPSPSRAHFARE